ncbi:MAG: hypothetical protein FD135_3626 [Comamonadaceae bacterium]|nr:MAG: hypothetical protein FD135_3626 [Comamonadaceae bacterium]
MIMDYKDMPLCASPLNFEMAVKLEVQIDNLLKTLGRPGDWGYKTKLGVATQTLTALAAEVRDQKMVAMEELGI